jgi:hypothetical protein
MSYTATYLNAACPSNSAMPSIGPVSETYCNSADSSSSDIRDNPELMDLLLSSKEAEYIRATFGDSEYDDIIEIVLAKRNSEAERLEREREIKKKRESSMPKGRFRRKLKTLGWKIRDAYAKDV